MSVQQITLGGLEFLLSIILSLVLVFITYRIVLFSTPKVDEEEQLRKKNAAMGIYLGSIFLGQAIIVKQSIYPVMAVIQLYFTAEAKSPGNFLKMLGLSTGYIILTGILAVLCILFCFWLFNRLTPGIDLKKEIENNNHAVAMMSGLLIIGIALLLSQGVEGLTRALIPFPSMGSFPLK